MFGQRSGWQLSRYTQGMSILKRLGALLLRPSPASSADSRESQVHSLPTRCSVCQAPAAAIYLTERERGWHLRFAGLCGMSFACPGPSDGGDPSSAEPSRSERLSDLAGVAANRRTRTVDQLQVLQLSVALSE